MKIVIATHKKIDFDLPKYYIPVQVNAEVMAKWDNYVHDSDGINISRKNYCYCELTAMYWLWKNCDDDIKGLCHYRRFFSRNQYLTTSEMDFCQLKNLRKYVLEEKEIKKMLDKCDAIVVRPYRPYPLTEMEDLNIWCFSEDIEKLRSTISGMCPEYLNSFDKIMKKTNLSHYNMFIARKELFDGYSEWLFNVLENVEKTIDISNYDMQHKRIYGYLAEALLNVYIEKNHIFVQHAKVVEPIEFDNINRMRLLKINLKEKIEQWLIRIKLYGIVEMVYKIFKPLQYKKYLEYKRAMR